MRTCTVVSLVFLVGLAVASIDPAPHTIVGKEFLSNQKELLGLLWHVNQPLWDPKQIEISNSFKIEENISSFKDADVVNRFVSLFNKNFFKKHGEPFSLYDTHDQWQSKRLVDLLVSAKDFDTFYKASVWARGHLNEGLFAYAFNIAKLHRADTYDIVLPPAYEVFPQLFVKPEVIKKAYDAFAEGQGINKDQPYVVYANYSGFPNPMNEDDTLSYFTEDVGLADYFNSIQLLYPYWVKSDDYGQERYNRRGDKFYDTLRNLIARYNLERQSNHLIDVRGYGYNRERLPVDKSPEDAEQFERRLYTAIDQGFLVDINDTKYDLRHPGAIEEFANAAECNEDSVNKELYGPMLRLMVDAIAWGKRRPGQFDHPVTSLRGPLLFRIYKRIFNLFTHFKIRQGPYPREQLEFPGVKVDGVTVDKLVTYFDRYDFELNNVIAVPNAEVANKLNIIARIPRLTHKPFNYEIKVTSDKDVDAVVRVFFGPRYDVYGREVTVEEARRKYLSLDTFVQKLKKGSNLVKRNSNQFTYYGQRSHSYSKLWEETNKALNSNTDVHVDDFVGDSDRLALPKGSRGGLPIRFYVFVNPLNDVIDSKVSFFPFDRPINPLEFDVPNSGYIDVAIYHRGREEVETA